MRIAVTGATGFIGCYLATYLIAKGHEVTATGRAATPLENSRRERLAKAGVQIVEGSLTNAGICAQVVHGCQAVIHLAAAQHEGNVPDSYFHDANVVGTRTLIEAAVGAGARRFVYGSTIGVYGHATHGELNEDSPTAPDNIYTRTKLQAEHVVAEYAQRIEVCTARISETYGPGDLRLLKLFKAIDRRRFILLGNGKNVRQVIYVDDLCQALLLASELPAAVNQTFVFSGSDVMTTNTMVRTIAQALGRSTSTLRIPVWPFRAAAFVLENTMAPLGIQPPLTQRRLDFFTKSFLFSTVRYRTLLGFTPQIPFDVGAARTVEWYREVGYL